MGKLKKVIGILATALMSISQMMPVQAANDIITTDQSVPKLSVEVQGEGSVLVDDGNNQFEVTKESKLETQYSEDTQLHITATAIDGYEVTSIQVNNEDIPEFKACKSWEMDYEIKSTDTTIVVKFDQVVTEEVTVPEEETVPEAKTTEETTIPEEVVEAEQPVIDVPKVRSRRAAPPDISGGGANPGTGACSSNCSGSEAVYVFYDNDTNALGSALVDGQPNVDQVEYIITDILGTSLTIAQGGSADSRTEHIRSSLQQAIAQARSMHDAYYPNTVFNPRIVGVGIARNKTRKTYNESYYNTSDWDEAFVSAGDAAGTLSRFGVQFNVYSKFKNVGDLSIETYHDRFQDDMSNTNNIRIIVMDANMLVSPEVSVSLHKASARPEYTNGNPNYTLEGAVYGVYSDSNATTLLKEMTTDANGDASVSVNTQGLDTLYIKEITAPKGYQLDETIYPVEINGSTGVSLNVEDTPFNDPVFINIKKISDSKVEAPLPLAEAQFTLKYYAIDSSQTYTADQLTAMTPTRTWVLESRPRILGNGKIVYEAKLGKDQAKNDYKIGGDDYYLNKAGDPIVPEGVVTIQETKAPGGYLTDNKVVDTIGDEEIIQKDGEIAILYVKQADDSGITKTVFSNNLSAENMNLLEASKRTGKFSVQKCDVETMKTNGVCKPQGNASFEGITYDVINNNDYGVGALDANGNVIGKAEAKGDVVTTITLNAEGKYTSPDGLLPVGKYILKEKNSGNSYVLSEQEYPFTVTEDGQNIDILTTDKVHRGGFTLIKYDEDTNSTRNQGDTNLSGTFNVVNKSTNAVKVNGTVYQPNEVVFSFNTDQDGNYTSKADLLPYGHYQIVEVEAPLGYTLQGTTTTEFDVAEDGQIVNLEGKLKDRVIVGRFDLKKVKNTTTGSSFSVPEPQAQFVVILKSKVNELYGGDADAAFNDILTKTNGDRDTDIDGLTKKEWDILLTDQDGYASTRDLAFGEYVFKQTASQAEYELIKGINTFVINKENQETKHYFASNTPSEYSIKVVKKDKETGETISYDSVAFKLKDANGQYVTMRSSQRNYDTFKSLSILFDGSSRSPLFVADNDPGVIVLPNELVAGTYTIEEVETPWGYVTTEPYTFTVGSGNIVEVTDFEEKVIVVELNNQRAYGKLDLQKIVHRYEDADKTFVSDDLSGIEFTIKATEDVINPINGEVLFNAGDIAYQFNVNSDGSYTLDNIPLGKYTLEETAVPQGVIKDNTVYELDFSQKDHETLKYEVSKEIENEVTKVEVSKTDITGQDELPGANLEIIDKENNEVVDQWTSTTTSHKIEGLKIGGTYILNERIAPEDYAKASTIEFTVNEDGSVSHVHMIDKQVTSFKYDACDQFVLGAKLSVYSEENGEPIGDAIDSWVTDGTQHYINNLQVGKTYVLVEEETPEGYNKSKNIVFTVEDDGQNQLVNMRDTQTYVSKESVGGKEVEGAKLTITDKETGEIIESWTSGKEKHLVTGLQQGKTYILTEDTAPIGYVKNSQVEFTVDDVADTSVTMIDTVTTINKVDQDGNFVKGAVLEAVAEDGTVIDSWTTGQNILNFDNGKKVDLINGQSVEWIKDDGTKIKVQPVSKTYAEDTSTTRESFVETMNDKQWCEIKKGNFSHDDTETILPMGKDVTYTATITNPDGSVAYYNIDLDGNETSHRLNNAVAGQTYTLRETGVPNGYYYTTDQSITPSANQDMIANMVDHKIQYQVIKVDDSGVELENAKMELYHVGKDGVETLIDEWTTVLEAHDISDKLIAGETYKIVESETPNGHYQAVEKVFTVDTYGTGDMITVTMVDVQAQVAFEKVNALTGEPVEGALYRIYVMEGDEEVNLTTFMTSTQPQEKDLNGNIIASLLHEKTTYYVKEVSAPFGYQLDETVHEFVLKGTKDIHQLISLKDMPKSFYVAITKVDAQDRSKKLKGAVLGLFDRKTDEPVLDVLGKQAIGTTDGEGNLVFNVYYSEDGYYAKEIDAPVGYRLSDKKYDVELFSSYDFADDNPIRIVVNNEAVPTTVVTSDPATLGLSASGLVGGLAAALLIAKAKKKKEEQE